MNKLELDSTIFDEDAEVKLYQNFDGAGTVSYAAQLR